jgi:hypothetical protein
MDAVIRTRIIKIGNAQTAAATLDTLSRMVAE